MGYDCQHDCCDMRSNCNHSHTVDPDECKICEEVRQTGRLPSFITTDKASGNNDIQTPLRSYENDSGDKG